MTAEPITLAMIGAGNRGRDTYGRRCAYRTVTGRGR